MHGFSKDMPPDPDPLALRMTCARGDFQRFRGFSSKALCPQLSTDKGQSADPAAETWVAAKAARILTDDALGAVAGVRTWYYV
ncbi:hypothetical protein [Streptomyces collinus]|uniref:hypothetical protein n=1 Tax=Streptomyces collinus TaxID=42684 RepID=UPI0029427F8B|nr:hypothetical protein [Streptomyces collinus]